MNNVFKAKKNAEVLQGVGKETDILVICKERGCVKITSEDLNILEEIYNGELEYGKENPFVKIQFSIIFVNHLTDF